MDNSKKRQLFNPKHVDKGVDMWIFFQKNKRFDKILCKPSLKYNVFLRGFYHYSKKQIILNKTQKFLEGIFNKKEKS